MTRARYWWKLVGLPMTIVVVGFVLLSIVACSMVDSALYHPGYGSRRAPATLQKVKTSEGTDIAVLHLPNPKARYTVWFFHGNAEALGDLEPFLITLRDHGFAVCAFDYPGYGLSEGKPTEETLYSASRIVRQYLHTTLGVSSDRVLIYGRSLGTGPATQMALEEKSAGLILQAPLVSAFRVVTHWRILPFDQFQNFQKIPDVKCPVLVMHGTADEVIPLWHGEAIFAAAHEPKQSLWLPAAHHNDFVETAGDRYWDALQKFSDTCAQGALGKP